MNPKKIGKFLQELRREKGLTQEQLAEEFCVSSRTISRWETGSNMPDISLLVELADFYDVDIREIVDGERKSEDMNYEIRNVAEKIADYADIEKQFLLTRVRLLNIIGLITGSVSIILNFTRLPEVTVFYTVLRDVMAGFTVGTLICTLLYITGVLEQVREKTGKAMTILVYVAFAIVVVCLLIAALYPQTR